ncbi:hypothetical protein ABZZ79_07305 [Streptomyces sp. NPDC006458]|uniref:hypothetical protein n=1 Tax=Streptomyces sp. NPDC006458 TaxID=3154302 RepID=UPI0033BCB8FF
MPGRRRPLLDTDPRGAADLIEDVGGRSAALDEARRHLAAVESALAGMPLRTTATDELRSLLAFLVSREL